MQTTELRRSNQRSAYAKRTIQHNKPKAPPSLESTIRVVTHGARADAVSIDGNSPLAYPFWKYKETDRDYHMAKARTSFWDRVNYGRQEQCAALKALYDIWMEKGVLYLAHDNPSLPNHSEFIREYLVYEARRLKAAFPGTATQAAPQSDDTCTL